MSFTGDAVEGGRSDTERFFLILQGAVVTQALVATVRLGLADLLASGPASVSALCDQLLLREEGLERLLLLLTAEGFVRMTCHDRFELTAQGSYLVRGTPESLAPFVELWGADWFWEAMRMTPECIRSGKSGLELSAGRRLFEYLDQVSQAGQQYDLALACLNEPSFTEAFVRAYPFDRCRLIVDVGAGSGETLAAVLRAFPAVRGIIFDRPRLGDAAVRTLKRDGLSARCEVRSGDFFEAIPSGGDLYILKWVIIDWDNTAVIRILETLRAAMSPHARLLVVSGLRGKQESLLTRQTDVLSLVVPGGFRRSEHEVISLFSVAGFHHMTTASVDRYWLLEFSVNSS